MIKKLIRLYLINVVALWAVSKFIDGFHLVDGIRSVLLVGVGFTFLHLLIGPIIKTILGPINFLTLGLIGLIVDAGLLYVLTIYFPQVSITPWMFLGGTFGGVSIQPFFLNFWGATLASAAVINVIRGVLSFLAE